MHDANLLENQPIAWTPTPDVIERAQLTKFMCQVGVSTWDELYEFSTRDVEQFTEEVLKFLDIKFDPPYKKLLDTSNGIEFPNWFLRSANRSADTPVRTDAASASEKTSVADIPSGPRTTSGSSSSFAGGTGDADTPVRTDTASASEKTSVADIPSGPSTTSGSSSSFAGGTGDADKSVRTDAASASEKTSVADIPSGPSTTSGSSSSFAGGTGDADKSVRAPSHAGLNITEMCLDRWQTDEMKGQPAVIWEGEDASTETLTYGQLADAVARCASGLRSNGLGCGDAIGIHLPMIPETVIALLAICRIGAIAVPVFSGYGVEAIVSRMNAVEAKALFTSFGFKRRGKMIQSFGFEAAGKCPTVETVFLLCNKEMPPTTAQRRREQSERAREQMAAFTAMTDDEKHEYLKRQAEEAERGKKEFYKSMNFSDEQIREFEQRSAGSAAISFGIYDIKRVPIEHPSEIVFWDELIASDPSTHVEPTSAEDPLIILYTSGTTGKPKGIAHTHASFPIKAAQDMAFGTDVGKGTRICWYTDIGWMMGPWLIYGALINGATICIYDGAPDYPTPDRMWEFCAKHKVEVLGISPTLVRALAAFEGSADTRERSADTPVRMVAASESKESVRKEKRGWYRHKLPHFDGNVTQFITFRLADSLAQGVLEQLRNQLEHDRLTEFSEEYRTKIEEHLDAGAGECILRDPGVARLVEETILNEHGTSCEVKAWVIMPNHAHVVLRLNEGYDLANVMKRIKGISARKINQHLGRSGQVWQADYFDRYIRDAEDFVQKCEYVEQNPVKAGLVKDASSWKFSSASGSADTPSRSADTPSRIADTPSRSADTPVRMSAKHEKTRQSSNDSVIAQRSTDEAFFAGGTGDADRSVRAPFERHDLCNLRIFGSTGEPWNPAPWWWLFEKVGNSKLPIINYSGGTEIAGGILMGNPLLPIKPCSFPAPCPGMDVDIFDENGEPVKPGEVGELVIKQPWIGMARGFWQEKERYLETYWSRFKNIWVHGDWAMRDEDGHWFILGRSDDTLKVAGKRVGPAEVESILVSHPLVTEAAVIGIPDETKGTAMVAFVVRSADTSVRTDAASTSEKTSVADLSDDPNTTSPASSFAGGTGDADRSVRAPLEAELKALVARDMGKPLTPSKIHFVSALPKTRNAKIMRRVIRSAYLNEDPGDLSSLENLNSINEIREVGK